MTSSRVKIPDLKDLVKLWLKETYPTRTWKFVDGIELTDGNPDAYDRLSFGCFSDISVYWWKKGAAFREFYLLNAADPEFFDKLKKRIDEVLK